MGTEVVQGLQHKHHIKLLLTPGSKHTTGQRSRGRPVDSSELRRYLIIRKDYDACTRERIPRGFLLQKKRQQVITYRAPFPPSLGSCNACLLQSHFSMSSWQCCRRVVSHRFHQFGRVFSRCFHLECFWGLVYSKFVSTTWGVTTLFGSCCRWCWCGGCRGRPSWLWVCVWYCQILELLCDKWIVKTL